MWTINFDDTNSYQGLNLIRSSCSISPAPVKTNIVDIAGADGGIDLTGALGYVRYGNRDCEFVFSVLPADDWESKKTEVANLLNGWTGNVYLSEDVIYYYEAVRLWVDEYQSDKMQRQIVVSGYLKPWKLKRTAVSKSINGAGILVNDRMPIIPTITCNTAITITFGGNSYSISAGTNKNLGIELTQGDNSIVTSAAATFSYREGAL